MRERTFVIAGAVAAAATMLGSGTAGANPATSIPGDGVYRVGVDIAPGIYQASGPRNNLDCFWQRLRVIAAPGDKENPNSYVIDSNSTKAAPIKVLIKPGDVGFRSRNCGSWVMLPAPPPSGSYGPSGSVGPEY
ncbi:MAG: hypothetical protein J2P18_15080 [Nocardia sp.]|nr:hypothetical protein [Nocardia sp.]